MARGSSSDGSVSIHRILSPNQLWWPAHIGLDEEEIQKGKPEDDLDDTAGVKPVHLNSSLCKFCWVFFDTWTDASETLRAKHYSELMTLHFKTWRKLEQSALTGCQLCDQFMRVQRLSRGGLLGLEHLDSCSPLEGIMTLNWPHYNATLEIPECYWMLCLGARGRPHLLKLCFEPMETMEQACRFDIPMSGHLPHVDHLLIDATRRSLASAQNWLYDCQTRHESCRPRKQDKKPTRLVKINNNKICQYTV